MKLHHVIRSVAALAWLVAAVDLSPWLWDMPSDRFLFTIAVACVCSYACIARAHNRPVDEVYLAGKDAGRREAVLEQECDKVTRLSERRLSVVPGDR